MPTNELKDPITKDVNNDFSSNQSLTLDAPLEDTTTKVVLVNDIDDYSNDGGDFNELQLEFFYYLYLDLFTNVGDIQDLHVINFVWLDFHMVQNDVQMKLMNDQNLGSPKENNATTYFEKHNIDLNHLVKYELEEWLPCLPLHSFVFPTYINLVHDQNRTLEFDLVKIENKFGDNGFIHEEEIVQLNNEKMNKLQAHGCSNNEKEENNIFINMLRDMFNER